MITDYTGQPAFVELLQVDTTQLDAKLYPRVSPVIVNDLNKDGQPELILAGSNLVYRKEGDNFQHIPFLDHLVIPLGKRNLPTLMATERPILFQPKRTVSSASGMPAATDNSQRTPNPVTNQVRQSTHDDNRRCRL